MNRNDIPVKNVELTPILISVYDRKKHLQACINALKKNKESSKTILYIVSDGWQHEGHRKSIEDVRAYINTITGFKEIKLRFRESNWGMRISSLDALQWVFLEHNKVIRMEDDIICSTHYLKYMNDALNIYEHDTRVFCICAHTHPKYTPPRNYSKEVFLWRSFSPWGFAIWKDQWNELLESSETERKELTKRSVWRAYCRNRATLTSRKNYISGTLHNDARIRLHMFLLNKYAIFPNNALSINCGLDGSGVHCGLGWAYPKQLLRNTPITVLAGIEPSKKIHRKLYRLNFSLLNHGIGGILRSMGCFDTLYVIFRRTFGSAAGKGM